jgi:FixJ family two-component response regulator
MPEITGLHVQQWLASYRHPLPIVFLTAQADLPDKWQVMARGAVDVLMKPVPANALVKGIEAALARDRMNRGPNPNVQRPARDLRQISGGTPPW